jgi:hypothetical protein
MEPRCRKLQKKNKIADTIRGISRWRSAAFRKESHEGPFFNIKVKRTDKLAVGKMQLAKCNWQNAVGKMKLAKKSWQMAGN